MEGFAFIVIAILGYLAITYVYAKKQGTYTYSKRRYRSSYKTTTEKGEDGEFFVKNIIGGTIQGKQYLVNDLTISEKGKTSQIDHILINSNGIYVIETKNYSGRIYGYEHQMQWTQVLNKNTINHFYNPLKQNATHVYQLKNVLNTKMPLFSMIVFIQGNIEGIHTPHVYTLETLRQEIHKAEGTYSITEMVSVYNQLEVLKLKNNVTKEEHIQNIRKTIDDIENNICPRCGTRLIKKNGKYGEFWGCARYPDCKFTKK